MQNLCRASHVIAGILLWCVSVMGGGLLPLPTNAQQITVVTEEFPPYNYTEDEKIVGIATEVVQATLERAGLEYEIKVYPWARSYKLAQEEPNTLIYSLVKSPVREELFSLIGPIAPPIQISLYKLKKRDDIVLESLEDAKQYKIGVVREDFVHQYLKKQGFKDNVQLFPHTSIPPIFFNFFKERIDLKVGNDYQQVFQARELGLDPDQIVLALPLSDFEFHLFMGLNKHTPDEIVSRVQQAFETVKAEGFIEVVAERYMQ